MASRLSPSCEGEVGGHRPKEHFDGARTWPAPTEPCRARLAAGEEEVGGHRPPTTSRPGGSRRHARLSSRNCKARRASLPARRAAFRLRPCLLSVAIAGTERAGLMSSWEEGTCTEGTVLGHRGPQA
ncbi:hypothetical protein PVAP13_9NG839456 [Panicum virgatum]|uniref:Uncharacterized protein n=1 Tax=Panicum virgatum TaxID=38727 RepID=A0A8T0MYT3_PANVG|nr:hypothetical protein PVAP13_9NG839456 [Panicum virgatum]